MLVEHNPFLSQALESSKRLETSLKINLNRKKKLYREDFVKWSVGYCYGNRTKYTQLWPQCSGSSKYSS